MYSFPYFKDKDPQRVMDFIRAHPFAFLSGTDSKGVPIATQIPVLAKEEDGKLVFHGHIMKDTDHYRAFTGNPNALLVFTGPSTYVSATWYSNPKMGSTWNYMSVHISGKLRFMAEEELEKFMSRFTLHFEGGREDSPTVFHNLSDRYRAGMMPMIAGFEIIADEMDHVFKLSQNRDEKSYRNIIRELELKGGESAMVAEEMRQRLMDLFPE